MTFENERFNSFSVDYKEFKKALKAMDAIHKGITGYARRERNIALSVHNGKFDIASWNYEGDTAYWQLDGDYAATGAVVIGKRHLDGIMAGKTLELSFSEIQGHIALHLHGDNEAVIMPKTVDGDIKSGFYEATGYEYAIVKKPVETEKAAEPVIVKKPAKAKKPRKRAPVRKAPLKQKETGYEKQRLEFLMSRA